MNLLKFLPKKLRENYVDNLRNAGIKTNANKFVSKSLIIGAVLAVVVSSILYFFKITPLLSLIFVFFISIIGIYFWVSLKAMKRIKKMEDVFPDFIQLMSSNLRAGMTVDKAFLSSARPELSPLDEEILKTGREIATGQDIGSAFKNLSDRINSEKITKVITLIISGLKAGGNISILLETTASNMREREFLEKRAASNILMYVIFIFIAVGFGAPILFGLSSILVEIIIKLVGNLPVVESAKMELPFTFSAIDITPRFIIYFSLIFLLITDFISSLVIGLVNKGDEKYGFRYVVPLIAISYTTFFLIRIFLSGFIFEAFSSIS